MSLFRPIRLLDTVALICDLPELGLVAGEVGAVVEELSAGMIGYNETAARRSWEQMKMFFGEIFNGN